MERSRSDEHIEQLLTRSFRPGDTPRAVCPDAELLAAFLDDGLDADSRQQVVQACRAEREPAHPE